MGEERMRAHCSPCSDGDPAEDPDGTVPGGARGRGIQHLSLEPRDREAVRTAKNAKRLHPGMSAPPRAFHFGSADLNWGPGRVGPVNWRSCPLLGKMRA